MACSDEDYIPGVKVPARLIPFPRSISDRARAALASFVGPDGTPPDRPPYPEPDDFEAWVRHKAASNEMIAAMVARQPGSDAPQTMSIEATRLGGALVHVATPAGLSQSSTECAYIEIHGGALVYGEGEFCRDGARAAAEQFGVCAYGVDYRTPPEHPYPAALDDCVAAYRALLDRYRPENIVVGGSSAGGNLAAALVLRTRDEGLPLPAALVLLTPEIDLTESGDSFEVNRTVDVVIGESLAPLNRLYAGGHDLADPYLSPLFGDFTKGYPPTFLQSGTRDMFLSNVVRMHRALRRANIYVELHVFEGMPHGGFFGAPEDEEKQQEVRRFVAEHWGRSSAR